ncbi:unnamed protein product [Rotaria sp. Silwood2]|nr:unnamed protein product [Rotaria sp. Silwood2]CAF4612448.1 unnamed protein product [Rotaria sp. Silwood2]
MNNQFCQKVLSSTTVIDFLLEHYIVWPWDITWQSNENKLKDVWREMFSNELLVDTDMNQYPIIIGIKPHFIEKMNNALICEYKSDTLITGCNLLRTGHMSTRDNVLTELNNFKKEFIKNERELAIEFLVKSGICKDAIPDLVKNHRLNESVNPRLCSVLSMLHEYETEENISQRSNASNSSTVFNALNSQQVTSLRLDTYSYQTPSELDSLLLFANIESLELINFEEVNLMKSFQTYFPNLKCLSLWYDNELDFIHLNNVLNNVFEPISRFEVHCSVVVCSDSSENELHLRLMTNPSIKYFILDLGNPTSTSINDINHRFQPCSFKKIIDLIQNMNRIHHFRLLTYRDKLNEFLDLYLWEKLADNCHALKEITLNVFGKIEPNEEMKQKIIQIRSIMSTRVEFEIRSILLIPFNCSN